ncbi:ribonuclease P protein component [Magnetococcus marinus]|uniref:ribonuclease P protein component n=1 Tax=Magnetococcus marinus TaxID=1124597 RepID=UPI00067406CB|nr:ribonuclease P protein component [Magnetococcus marinus]
MNDASPHAPQRACFPKSARLLTAKAFRQVLAAQNRVQSRAFVLYSRDGSGADPRVGLTVSRKVGKAYVRNRIKRVARELFRSNRQRLAFGRDFVLIARNRAASMDNDALRGELNRLFKPHWRDRVE